ncbi:MAG: M23 family metallopeptidase [Gemmatimonadaceae bacterium]
MKSQLQLALLVVTPAVAGTQHLEVRVAPAERIYLHEVHRGAGIVDFVVQNVAIVNRGNQRLTLYAVRYEVLRRDQVILALHQPSEILEPTWKFLKGYLDRPGMMTAQRSVFLFDSLLRGAETLSPTLQLERGTAVLIARRPFVTSLVVPDQLRIVATARTDGGADVSASAEVALVRHTSPNEYAFPVTGRWYVASSASLHSHHRWRPASEFALDLTRIGEGGSSFRGDGTQPSDYYAYGAAVVAVAAGRVVHARNDVRDNELPKPNETRAAFAERVLTPLWVADPTGELASGNIIVIEHANGEYSAYVHLRRGSVRLTVGDSVRAGQHIAEVGFSGDGFQPHLHFQITRGRDPNFSAGVPVSFVNIRPIGMSSTIDVTPRRHLLTGEFIETVSVVRP